MDPRAGKGSKSMNIDLEFVVGTKEDTSDMIGFVFVIALRSMEKGVSRVASGRVLKPMICRARCDDSTEL